MTDEVNVQAPQPPQRVEQDDPVKQKARTQGWVPQKDWKGDPADWRPAKEFVDRGELFNKIEEQNKHIKKLNGQLDALQKHNKNIFDMAHKQAITDLKREHRDAVQQGDIQRADAIVSAIEQKKEELVQVAQQAATGGPPPEFHDFVQRNTWYESDTAMRGAADAFGIEYLRMNPDSKADPTRVLAYVEGKMRDKFPQLYGSRKTAAPDPVASATSPVRASQGRGFGEADLTPEELKVMTFLEESGTMDRKTYMRDIARARGIDIRKRDIKA